MESSELHWVNNPLYSVITSFVLGSLFGGGLILGLSSDCISNFGWFMFFLGFFHLWEYSYVGLFQEKELSWNSFLLNHSQEFHIAMALAVCEYWVEWFLFPSLKMNSLFKWLGFLICVGGQSIRTLAMYTAGTNFHHHIRETKSVGHNLVTWGIYSILRHPSYFGWFWWSIGTQILLFNPVSLILYTYASWQFFNRRIPDEEETLVHIFGSDYERYCAQTPIGIPFIISNFNL